MAMKYCQPSGYRRYPFATDECDDNFNFEDCVTDVDIFKEVEKNYGIQNLENVEFQLSTDTRETEKQKSFDKFDEEISKLNDNKKRNCAYCATQDRIVSTSSFKTGQHIAKLGDHCRTYFKINRKQICPYDHHMIVKEVIKTTKNKAEMKLIHFTKNEDNEITICETEEIFDLSYDEVYLVRYRHPKYSPSQIVQRAETMLPSNRKDGDKFKKYKVFTGNCEHFATWCVVGEGESLQVQGLREKIKNAVFGVLGPTSMIAKGLMRILRFSTDEISSLLSKAANVLPSVLAGTAGLYLIYSIFMTILHIRDYQKCQICRSCLKTKVLNIWLSFGAFSVASGIQYIILIFALPLISNGVVGIPLMIIVILLSVALQTKVSVITNILRSPFSDEGREVKKMSEIEIGDIVQLKYFKLDHTVLVSKVEEDGIIGIHYAGPPRFGKRMVKEEKFQVNLKKSKVKVIDTRFMNCYPPNIVVERGRKRLGETKFDALSNRSSHFCFWAKADFRSDDSGELDDRELGESKCKDLSSLCIGKREVFLEHELELGDVVSIGKCSIGNILLMETKGILVRIAGHHRNRIRLEIMVHKNMHVRREKCSVDLLNDRVFVHKYVSGQCKKMDERKRSVERMEDKFHLFLTTEKFIEKCIINPK